MHRSRLFPFLVALGVAACSSNSGSGPTTPSDQRTNGNAGAEITLAPGMTVDVADVNLRVRFDRVTQDSRCPTNGLILCVWEGSAQVQLQVSRLVGAENLMSVLLETAGSRDTTTVFGQPLTLVRVDPPKVTLDPIPAGAYRAVIRVGLAR
jgi:hypothetical protein